MSFMTLAEEVKFLLEDLTRDDLVTDLNMVMLISSCR